MALLRSVRPSPEEHAPYYARYIELVPQADLLETLERQLGQTRSLLRETTEAAASTRHPPYTWTIKEVVGHLIDVERVFGHRALRFARGDATPLPGFDEQKYVPEGRFDRIPLGELLNEFELVRRSHLAFFRHLPEEAWLRTGLANDSRISVRALAYILAGHERHHMAIVARRLGLST